uniref:Uncharacterized protein n=1 Tax=Arundo donax TaxID=35708 RepID=A0A0A9BCZ3_ARUDO
MRSKGCKFGGERGRPSL